MTSDPMVAPEAHEETARAITATQHPERAASRTPAEGAPHRPTRTPPAKQATASPTDEASAIRARVTDGPALPVADPTVLTASAAAGTHRTMIARAPKPTQGHETSGGGPSSAGDDTMGRRLFLSTT